MKSRPIGSWSQTIKRTKAIWGMCRVNTSVSSHIGLKPVTCPKHGKRFTSRVHFIFRKHDLLLNTMKKKIREKKMHKTRSNSQVMYVYVWKNNDKIMTWCKKHKNIHFLFYSWLLSHPVAISQPQKKHMNHLLTLVGSTAKFCLHNSALYLPLSSTTLVCCLLQSIGNPIISTSTKGSMI